MTDEQDTQQATDTPVVEPEIQKEDTNEPEQETQVSSPEDSQPDSQPQEEVQPEKVADQPVATEPEEAIAVLSRAEQYHTIKPGMTIRVHERITDINAKGEEKKRVQVFEGIVLARKHNQEPGATVTVRKVSNGIGVEKIYPLNTPDIEKIEIIKQARVRQSRPYYLRKYPKRLKEKRIDDTITATA